MTTKLLLPHTVVLSRQRVALAKSRRTPIGLAQCSADKRPSTDAVTARPLLRTTVSFDRVI